MALDSTPDGYTDIRDVPYPFHGLTCNDCGALVLDSYAHDDWHARLQLAANHLQQLKRIT